MKLNLGFFFKEDISGGCNAERLAANRSSVSEDNV